MQIWGEIGGTDGEGVFSQDEFAQKVKTALEDEFVALPNTHNDLPILKQLYVRGQP